MELFCTKKESHEVLLWGRFENPEANASKSFVASAHAHILLKVPLLSPALILLFLENKIKNILALFSLFWFLRMRERHLKSTYHMATAAALSFNSLAASDWGHCFESNISRQSAWEDIRLKLCREQTNLSAEPRSGASNAGQPSFRMSQPLTWD